MGLFSKDDAIVQYNKLKKRHIYLYNQYFALYARNRNNLKLRVRDILSDLINYRDHVVTTDQKILDNITLWVKHWKGIQANL